MLDPAVLGRLNALAPAENRRILAALAERLCAGLVRDPSAYVGQQATRRELGLE